MQPPRPKPSFRYRLARFKTLAHPKVWLSSFGLIGLAVFAWEFSQRPEWRRAMLEGDRNKPFDEAKREEDAIKADIDTLPLLDADLKSNTTPSLDATDNTRIKAALERVKAANKKNQQETQRLNQLSLDALFSGGGLGKSTSKLETPRLGTGLSGTQLPGGGLSSIGNAVTAPGLNSPSGTSGLGDLSLNAPGSSRLSSRPTSANSQLSNALNRYSPARPNPSAPLPVKPSEEPGATPQPTPAIEPIAGSTSLKPVNPATPNQIVTPIAGSNAINPALLARPKTPPGSLNSFTGLTSGAIPETATAPAPSKPATTIRSRTPRSVKIPVPPPSMGSSSPSFSVPRGSTPLPPGTALSAPTAPSASSSAPVRDIPFTAPRSTPGRRIGGGQIGTFSNP